ncbi:MAG: hypothetical protein AB7E23_00105 [Bacilli bacterium]
MEIKEENGRSVLYAAEGKVLQSVTDGLIIGPWLILGKNDSKIHYHDIDEPMDEALPKASAPKFHINGESTPIE